MNTLSHLTDEKLLEALKTAKRKNLAEDFVQLLEEEVEKRGLRAQMCS
ncbi:sporulation histidine kinase inhibitor Sda [Jeotgalibacillus salarius]|uniref:Sporulation histidine kinase inhibitor Sda n=1 Tax=Jeotgalibacillus salarius TaxID=546023 RepID=A0A4Y8LC02_9BACL|nr:sporulation histidine kinase inhibitor Sda [Jeotgalibacillus salarius]TFD99700.1 sporulation histidine kinase inhibitor Sda [Jeotgalibacillus salarius]